LPQGEHVTPSFARPPTTDEGSTRRTTTAQGFEREFRLPSGRRADAVNLETREVLELKPNNPRALQRGQTQLEGYLKELEQTYGGEWTGRVVPYDR